MPIIRTATASFPSGSVTNGTFDHNCTWSELVWAAITFGKRDLFDVVRFGRYSFFEIVYRCAILYANLKERNDGFLIRSDVYDGQDPSEKGATSYFLGLTCAKLMAERYLNVPWLMHLDVYRHRVAAVLTGRSRPDLIGRNGTGDWIVMEAKGRTGAYDQGAMDQAKYQSKQIASISGKKPVLYSAVQAHFSDGRLNVEWHDPPRDEEVRAHLDISPEELQVAYYRPFLRMLEERSDRVSRVSIQNSVFSVVELPDADIRVGVEVPVATAVGPVRSRRERVVFSDHLATIGSDGILVELGSSWSGTNMHLEPQQRSRGEGGLTIG